MISFKHLILIPLELFQWIEFIFMLMPGKLGLLMRRIFIKLTIKNVGRKCNIGLGFHISGRYSISLGDYFNCGRYTTLNACGGSIDIAKRVFLNTGVIINADLGGRIIIGSDVLIGPNVIMRTANHNYNSSDVLIRNQGHNSKDIVIEDDVWIGAGAIILGGSIIRKGAVIAAGSLVKTEIHQYCVVAGSPAKLIKSRNP